MPKKNSSDQGFVSLILIVVIALIVMKYFFDWSIFEAAVSEKGRETIDYIKEVIRVGWDYIYSLLLTIVDKIRNLNFNS